MAGGIWMSVQGEKVALLLGKGKEGVSDIVVEEMSDVLCIGQGSGGREGKNCCMGSQ